MSVSIEKHEHIWTVIIDRAEKKNAVDRDTADRLYEAFTEFDRDEKARAAVLWGRGGTLKNERALSEFGEVLENSRPNICSLPTVALVKASGSTISQGLSPM